MYVYSVFMYVCICVCATGKTSPRLTSSAKKTGKKKKKIRTNRRASCPPLGTPSREIDKMKMKKKMKKNISGIPDGDFRAARPRNSSTQIIECHAHCWDSVHGEDKVAPVPYMGTYVHVYVISHMYMYMYICVCVCVCVVHMSMYMLYLIYMYICIYIYI